MSTNIIEIYDKFNDTYNESILMISHSNVFVQNQLQHEGVSYSEKMHYIIIERNFMNIYLAWELFLENSFIAYLLNAQDLQSLVMVKYATPINREHAYDMIRGTKQYPDWTNIDDIKRLANIYFENSGHFSILSSPSPEFLEMKTIRNRISHVSEKSVRSFNNLLSRNISQTNISPGEYLMKFKSGSTTYFSFYSEMIKGYVDAICNTTLP